MLILPWKRENVFKTIVNQKLEITDATKNATPMFVIMMEAIADLDSTLGSFVTSPFDQGKGKVVGMCSKTDTVTKNVTTRHVSLMVATVRRAELNFNATLTTTFTAQVIMLMENVTRDVTTQPADGTGWIVFQTATKARKPHIRSSLEVSMSY